MNRYLVAIAVALGAQAAHAQTAPEILQQRSNWCWAAVSESILNAYGVTPTQLAIAEYGTPGSTDLATSPDGITNALTSETFNPHRRGVSLILNHFGNLPSTHRFGTLSMSECVQQSSPRRPFAIAYAWATGGGHAVVGTHCDPLANTISVMDPLHGNRILNYANFVSSSLGNWTETLTVAPPSSPPGTPTTPAAPQLQAVYPGVCDVRLQWLMPAVGVSLSYQIERRSSGAQWAVVEQLTGGSPGVLMSDIANQPCSTPTPTAVEYRMRAWNSTGTSPAHFSAYSAPISVSIYSPLVITNHPEFALKVENVPQGLHVSWGPYAWTKTVIERRSENGSWAPLTEVWGDAQRTGFVDTSVPEFQPHVYRYRAGTNSWTGWKYSSWSNEVAGTRFGAWLVPLLF